MEDQTSGIDHAVLAQLKSLARRGAHLKPDGDGQAVIEQVKPGRAPSRLTPQEFLRFVDAGWLTAIGADRFVISRRGVSALRGALNRLAAASEVRTTGVHAQQFPPARATASQPTKHGAAKPGQNIDESPLSWLRRRKDPTGKSLISQIELDAGERLRADFELGQLMPRVTASWNAAASSSRQPRGTPSGGMELSDVIIAARQRVDAALAAIGPELSGALVDVCCFLKGLEQAERNGGWPRRAGKVVLQLGLAHLARHYGMGTPQAKARPVIRHWGSDGFRPRVKAEPKGDD